MLRPKLDAGFENTLSILHSLIKDETKNKFDNKFSICDGFVLLPQSNWLS